MAEVGPSKDHAWQAVSPALLRVAAATTLVVLMFSLLNPVLAVRLQQAGVSASAIGVFAMLPFASVALLIPLMPLLFDRIGVGRAYRIGLMLEFTATLGYGLVNDYALWCVLAGLSGAGAAAAWNGTEALIAYNAPPARRGRITGLYQMVLGGALMVGPFLPALLSLGPSTATWVACGGLALGLAITAVPGVDRLRASRPERRQVGMLWAMRRHPFLVWVALVGGVFEAGLSSITSAYGSQLGLSLGAATSIAGVLGVGSFTLQYPIGWLADHVRTHRLLLAAGTVLLIGSAPFALALQLPAVIWMAAFVWGAVGGALYTLTMIRVAHDFADSSAIAGTAAVIAGYTAGGALGPLVSGMVLDRFGALGQAGWLSLLAMSVLLGAWPSRPAASQAS